MHIRIYTMDKVVQRLMNNLLISRNWITLLNCTTSQCSLHFSADVRQLADNYKSSKNGLDSRDINNDLGTFIKGIEKNHRNMNLDQVISTLNALHQLLDNKQLDVRDLKEIKGFEYMCNIILKNTRTLNTYNAIRILHILLSFNVSPNSLLIQTLIQLISVSIHKLTVSQIMMLHSVLHNLQDVPIVKALLKASSLAFRQQAQLELSLESTNLVKVLRFCSVIKNVQTKNYIIKLLAGTEHYINPMYVVDIFYAIYTLPELDESCKDVLIKVNKVIKSHAQSLSFKEIENLLHYISMKFADSEMDFYDQTVVDTLCTTLLDNELSSNEIILITKHLNKMRYSNIDLLKCLLKKCLEDNSICNRFTDMQIRHLVTALVIANYKPHNWEIVEKMLLNRVVNMERSLYDTAVTAFQLLSIDCYCPELLNKVLTLYNLVTYVKDEQLVLIMLKLHWGVKLFYPQYQGAMLDESKLNQIVIKQESNNMPDLRESLEKVVGSSKYVKSNLVTKIGESVDHAIVIQQDGSFVNIKNLDITFAEELDSFLECDKILFFGYPKEAYCTNTKDLLPTVQMLLKTIESLTGFYTFVINTFLWDNFSSTRRIEHLKEGIKLICSNTSNK
ncbi:uncharacterized protein LOC143425717 [Xylocopa sonorina]|uniref:uncharacterized protein LOC143425717 n=1 Tax=Xylocopa sonorina TaxID=1818115 RepID=UPI00403AE333